jgi:hypothetical protein
VYAFETKYAFRAADKLRFESKSDFQYSKPWYETDACFPFDKTVRKYTGGLTAFCDPADGTCLLGGAQFPLPSLLKAGGLPVPYLPFPALRL